MGLVLFTTAGLHCILIGIEWSVGARLHFTANLRFCRWRQWLSAKAEEFRPAESVTMPPASETPSR